MDLFQMAMDYAWNIDQELIMVQLDLEKAYDHVKWALDLVCLALYIY